MGKWALQPRSGRPVGGQFLVGTEGKGHSVNRVLGEDTTGTSAPESVEAEELSRCGE